MAVRGWGASVATAIGIAAGAGAAQYGLGYGLGIIDWRPTGGDGGEAVWVGNIAWTIWIGASATVLGALGAHRLGPGRLPASPAGDGSERPSPLGAALGRTSLAVAAAVGALITVALVAVPARAATRADTFSPQTIAAGHAVIGVIGGLLAALWALASRAAARNVIATTGWLWLLAIVAVTDHALTGPGLATAQLGVWELTAESERYWFRNYFYWPGAVLSLGSALVIGALAAGPSARQATNRVGAAISGGLGPMLVAAAYFLAAPRLAGIRGEQLSAHLLAPYGVIVGLAGSVLVTALAQRASRGERPASAQPAEPADGPAPATNDEPKARGRAGVPAARRGSGQPAPSEAVTGPEPGRR